MIPTLILTLLLSLLPVFIIPSSPPIIPSAPIATPPPPLTLVPTLVPDSSQWHYPNASIISSSPVSLVLTSPDNPVTITAWYKDMIDRTGYSIRSTINTTTNGRILNRLTAGHQSQTIDIEISKRPNQNLSTISIRY